MPEDGKAEVKEQGKQVVVQMQMPSSALEHAVAEGTRATLIKGAIGYIIEKLTPEMMTQFATQLVDNLTKDIFGGTSYKFKSELEKVVEPMIKEALNRPENLLRIRTGIDQGIEQAIKEIPEKTRQAVVERAMTALKRSWENR